MIYTVTVNPALDYVMILKKMDIGQLNRSSRELHYYGGKGINISVVLNNLKISSVCLGFVAGYVGEEIERGLNSGDAGQILSILSRAVPESMSN